MPASRFSRRERSYAATHTTVPFNASGSYPVPYGKTKFVVSGKGADGTAPYGGNYAGDNSYTNAVVNYPPNASNPVPPTNYPPNASNPVPPTANPPNASNPVPPNYDSNSVEKYMESNNTLAATYNVVVNYTTACPPGSYNTNYYIAYVCTPNYTAQPPNASNPTPDTNYPPNASNPVPPTNYPPNASNPVPPTGGNYVAGNPNYNAYVAGNTGASATILGQTFPGGYQGPATAINAVAISIPFSNTAVPVTVPSGGYITIQNT